MLGLGPRWPFGRVTFWAISNTCSAGLLEIKGEITWAWRPRICALMLPWGIGRQRPHNLLLLELTAANAIGLASDFGDFCGEEGQKVFKIGTKAKFCLV